MSSFHKCIAPTSLIVAIGAALFCVAGCTSNSDPKTAERERTTGSSGSGGHVNVMCIGDRINEPPESFHYSYKYSDASSSVNKEADITPQKMDITIKDASGTHSFHGARNDEASWNSAVLDLSGLGMTAMMARLDSLNDTSAVSRQAAETLNGYNSTRYSIDSTKASATDQEKFAALFGAGAFEKGTAWVGTDGCAVKLVLDERISLGSGSNATLKDDHYELARSKE